MNRSVPVARTFPLAPTTMKPRPPLHNTRTNTTAALSHLRGWSTQPRLRSPTERTLAHSHPSLSELQLSLQSVVTSLISPARAALRSSPSLTACAPQGVIRFRWVHALCYGYVVELTNVFDVQLVNATSCRTRAKRSRPSFRGQDVTLL